MAMQDAPGGAAAGTEAGSARPTSGGASMQAVVVIHGMGEQIPMDTLKGFVRAVWQEDKEITQNGLPHPTDVWSKPDQRTGSLELRRITTRESIPSGQFPDGVRTDFYELYWADLTAGTPWDEFVNWVCRLLFRPIGRVPPDVRLAWALLWIATLVVVAFALVAAMPAELLKGSFLGWLSGWHWAVAIVAGAMGTLLHKVATKTFGRVVRYTRADPDNIAARQAVRERGLKLLRDLHQGSNYKRIVVVAHSLGTILAHDLLSYFWAERDAARAIGEGTPAFAALCDLEAAAGKIHRRSPDQASLAQYLAAQRALRLQLAQRPAPPVGTPPAQDARWLISDLVTLGSPLTHAEFLLASDKKDLGDRKVARELAESPPFREQLDPKSLKRAVAARTLPIATPPQESRLISYPDPKVQDLWHLHHAAPYAAVRWTNVYDPARLVFCGDVIGGPLAGVFGPAIVDVDLRDFRGPSCSFTHTKYWALDGEEKHIRVLREAVNLLDRPDADPNQLPDRRR
jgi:hypothetical protein